MSVWPSTGAARVLRALISIGWTVKPAAGGRKSKGAHVVLQRPGWPNFVWAFHQGEEIGPRMLARIAKHTGLTPEDL